MPAADRPHKDCPAEGRVAFPVLARHARVPEEFRAVRWTRLPGGNASNPFVDRLAGLLSLGQSQSSAQAPGAEQSRATHSSRNTSSVGRDKTSRSGARLALIVLGAAAVIAGGYFALGRHASSQRETAVASSPAPAAVSGAAPEKSIAVLPFVDMSEKKDQEYFSDGLSEELIDHLTHSADLKVIARTSSFQFKGKNEDVRTIAGQLGVANLLEGSVRMSGHDMRITAQLIRASDGTHLWSQTYDRKMSDVFKVQDEIAETVVQALKVTLNDGTDAGKEQNLAAYQLLLKGNFFYSRSQRGDLDRSLDAYKQALALDPNYALAWAMVARSYIRRGTTPEVSHAEVESKSLEALQRALSLNPNLAIALDPNSSDGIVATDDLLASRALLTGKFDELLRFETWNLARNPLDTAQLFFSAWISYLAGHLDDGLVAIHRLLELNPAFENAHANAAHILLAMGRNDEALVEIQKETDEESKTELLAKIYWAMARTADADKALQELESKFAGDSAFGIAEVYALRRDTDAALTWLERAYQQRDWNMISLKVDPQLSNIRSDPRYQTLLRQMNMAA